MDKLDWAKINLQIAGVNHRHFLLNQILRHVSSSEFYIDKSPD